jgi:hypothetical protein
MKLRIVLAFAVVALAAPAYADLKSYKIVGDQSTLFPTCGTILRPGTQSGIAIFSDDGGGTPTLVELQSQNQFIDIVGGTVTSSVPGTTVVLNNRSVAQPSLPQVGVGQADGPPFSISWGALTGWTQTGRLNCTTHLGNGGTPPPSSCVLFVGFEGTGPPAPLKGGGASFNTDPWTFTITGGAERFDTPSVEFVNLGGGAVTANVKIGGGEYSDSPIPALPLIGVAGLGAALLYLGARAIRGRSR